MRFTYILDENENPIVCENIHLWGKWLEAANRHIAEDKIGIPAWKRWLGNLLHLKKQEPVRISTVFLGLDHNFSGTGPPLLYETMIFGGKYDQHQQRYATKAEALAGHKKCVMLALAEKII